MSRQYDQNFVDVPYELFIEDEWFEDGVGYKRIDGFPAYFITTQGDVISLKNEQPRIIKPWHTNHGHLYVDITNNANRRIRCYIHRLVAEAFIPNPDNYPVVRHLDDNPYNNWVDNLAWGTQSDNMVDAIRNGNFYMEEVYCVEDDMTFPSIHEAARYYGTTAPAIFHNCNGQTHSCKGKHFCYDRDASKIDESQLIVYTGFKPLIGIDPDGNEHYFESRKEAARIIGIPDCGISSVINGHLEHTHDWRFREANIE